MTSRSNHTKDVFKKLIEQEEHIDENHSSNSRAPAPTGVKTVATGSHKGAKLAVVTDDDPDDATAPKDHDSAGSSADMPSEPTSTESHAAKGDSVASVESDGHDETGGEADDHRSVRRARIDAFLRKGAIGVAVLIFIAAIGLSGFLYWQVQQRNDVVAAGQGALNVAKSYAVTLSSIDTKNIDKNFAEVLDGATGEFKGMYSQSSAQLRQLLVDNKAVSHGTVIDAAIKSATTTHVEILLFVDQAVSNAVNPNPRVDRLRITMTMELVDKHWLASRVDIS